MSLSTKKHSLRNTESIVNKNILVLRLPSVLTNVEADPNTTAMWRR